MKPWKIDRETKLVISASASPSNFGVTIYNELFQRLELPFVYMAVKSDDAGQLAAGIRALKVRGASISMPLKHQILLHLDHVEEEATTVQSVNTVVHENGKLAGYNTDLDGLRAVLGAHRPREVLVYGSGSVTDSVLMVLREIGAKAWIRARNPLEAGKKSERWGVDLHQEQSFDLFLNATPMSLKPIGAEVLGLLQRFRPKVFDLVVPLDNNHLFDSCRDLGLDYVPGFEMYKQQFVRQFALYTGHAVEPSAVEEIARDRGLI